MGGKLVGGKVESRTGGRFKGRIVGLLEGASVVGLLVEVELSDGALLKIKLGLSETLLGMPLGTVLGKMLGYLLGSLLGPKLCCTLGPKLGPLLGSQLG